MEGLQAKRPRLHQFQAWIQNYLRAFVSELRVNSETVISLLLVIDLANNRQLHGEKETEMAQLIDWTILSNKPSLTSVIPEERTHSYDLFNVTTTECLVYGHRYGDNINLVWGDPAKSDNILVQRKSAAKGPLKFEELIAISVREGGFLRISRVAGDQPGVVQDPKIRVENPGRQTWRGCPGGETGRVVQHGRERLDHV